MDGQQAAVGGNLVSDSDVDDITGHEELGLDGVEMAVAEDLCVVGGVLLESGDSLLGAALLRNANYGIENEDGKNLVASYCQSLLSTRHTQRLARLHTTAGSTKAVLSLPSSNRASTKEIPADASNMITSWSLNCSRISCQRGVGGSSGRAIEKAKSQYDPTDGLGRPRSIPFFPYFARAASTCCSLNPFVWSTWKWLRTSSPVAAYARSILELWTPETSGRTHGGA